MYSVPNIHICFRQENFIPLDNNNNNIIPFRSRQYKRVTGVLRFEMDFDIETLLYDVANDREYNIYVLYLQ